MATATSFEAMSSPFTKFWHPPVDKTDSFDPTFLGVQRKAKVVPHLTAQHEERGKRIRTDMQAHDPSALMQNTRLYAEPSFGSNVASNRFGPGFLRRQESTIQQDRQRLLKDADGKEKHEAGAASRRVRAASRNFSQYDVITGEPTFITKHYPTAKPMQSDKPELLHKVMRWPEMATSSLSPAGAPPARAHRSEPGSNGGSAFGGSMPELSRRAQRIANEGLTVTKKEWSVAQQLKCNDGYVMPKI